MPLTWRLVPPSSIHSPRRPETVVDRRWVLTLPGGPPLGFEAGQAYEAWSGRLDPGDALVLYTDGVTEAFDLDDVAFGEQRLLDTLSADLDASGQCQALLAAVQAHAGEAPQSDDITVMVLRYRRDTQGG